MDFIKQTITIAVLALAVGLGAGLLINQNKKGEVANSEPEQREAKRTASTERVERDERRASKREIAPQDDTKSTVRTITLGGDQDNEAMQKWAEDFQQRQQSMMQKRAENKFDARIASLVKELGLSSEQEQALRAFFNEKLTTINGGSANMTELAAAMRGDGLNEFLEGLLDEEQTEKLAEYEERQKNNKLQASALRQLSRLQQTLDLTDEQKEAVYQLYVEDAEKQLAATSDADVVTQSMLSGMGLDLDDMGMGGAVTRIEMPGNAGGSREEMLQQLKDQRQQEIDQKVGRLSEVLTEQQQDQYRKNLESKGGFVDLLLQDMPVGQ